MHVNYKVNQPIAKISQFYNKQIFIIFAMENEIQAEDLDEALLVISLKNDEINSLKSSIKGLQKKNNIKLADLQFKIDQQKSKQTEMQRKSLKNQQHNFKLKEKYQEQVRKLQADNNKLLETINELHSQQRRKEREFKAAIFQQRLKCQKERQHSIKLSNQLENIHRYFNPNKILKAINKQKIQELPSYIELHRKYEEKVEQVKQINLRMSRLQSETMLSIEESFKKLSSYQAVMQSLNSKNNQLQQSIMAKEKEIELHSLQIVQKKQLIQQVQERASQQLDTLNDQILTLRNYVNKEDAKQQHIEYSETHINYQNVISELQQAIEQNEHEMGQMQSYYEDKVNYLVQQNQRLNRQMANMQINLLNQREHFQSTLISLKQIVSQKDYLILQLSSSIQQQREVFVQKKRQLQSYIVELTDYLKKKKKEEQEHRQQQISSKERIQTLQQELTYLKLQIYHNDKQQSVNQYNHAEQFDTRSLKRVKSGGVTSLISIQQHRNLFADIQDNSYKDQTSSKVDIGKYEQEPNWSELYYALLCKHNAFAKKVQSRLQSMRR